MLPYAPFLCWIIPIIGSVVMLLFGRIQKARRFRNHIAVTSIGLCTIFSLSMIPDILLGNTIDWRVTWAPFELGVLVDPLNVIMTCVVCCIGLFVTIFSTGYMNGDPDLTRFWFFIQLFIAGYVIIVIADNLLLMFIGWEIVGLCCTALTTFWHKDSQKANQGLKVFMILRVGDILFLISILLIYVNSGTFNLVELQQQTGWMMQLSGSGLLLFTALLLFGGAVCKSAQFPLQVWLPSMLTTSPSSFNALTECLAGPFLIARVLPIFRQALALGYNELLTFFLTVAWMGAFSALLGALIAVPQRNIWYVLAYSISSVIGYMMVALGLAGLMNNLASGYLAGTFLLTVDAFIAGLLFIAAAFISYVKGSDDMFNMSGIKSKIAHMGIEIPIFALISLPPLSGFWCTNWIQTVALDFASEAKLKGQLMLEISGYGLFALLIIAGAVTAFYGIKMMGLIFRNSNHRTIKSNSKKIPAAMRVSFISMLVVTMIIDFSVPLLIPFFNSFFSTLTQRVFLSDVFDVFTFIVPSISTFLSISAIVIGGYPAYRMYIADKSMLLVKRPRLIAKARDFLWNQCYIEVFYNKIAYGVVSLSRIAYRYVEMLIGVFYHRLALGVVSLSRIAYRYVEMEGIEKLEFKGANQIFSEAVRLINSLSLWMYPRIELRGFDAFNYKFSASMINLSKKIRKTHTGILSYNMLAFLIGIILITTLLIYFGGGI